MQATAIKWHGGKAYLASKIVARMPPRVMNPNKPAPDDPGYIHYVEPFFGGGSVLLANDPEGISEVVSDLNGDLVNFWQVLQQEHAFRQFMRWVEATPFSESLWENAGRPVDHWPRWRKAAEFFVRCRQSLAGRQKGFTGITKTRARRGMNNEVSAWLTAIDGLPEVHKRLQRVLILNDDALSVIRSQDGPRTLFYLDPPYLHETRATTSEYGAFEMREDQHEHLLDELCHVKGRFLLSGYRSRLYDDYAANFNWRRTDFDLPNQAAGGKTKRRMVECVWSNYSADT